MDAGFGIAEPEPDPDRESGGFILLAVADAVDVVDLVLLVDSVEALRGSFDVVAAAASPVPLAVEVAGVAVVAGAGEAISVFASAAGLAAFDGDTGTAPLAVEAEGEGDAIAAEVPLAALSLVITGNAGDGLPVDVVEDPEPEGVRSLDGARMPEGVGSFEAPAEPFKLVVDGDLPTPAPVLESVEPERGIPDFAGAFAGETPGLLPGVGIPETDPLDSVRVCEGVLAADAAAAGAGEAAAVGAAGASDAGALDCGSLILYDSTATREHVSETMWEHGVH